MDADSHPSAALFADVAKEIEAGDRIAGGVTVRMDEYHFFANWIVKLWNLTSRGLRLLAGSFIFCETATFRKIGGFSNELFVAEELELSTRLKKIAKEEGKKLVILHRHPLVTSARKMKLYTIREHLRFIFRGIQPKSAYSPAGKQPTCGMTVAGKGFMKRFLQLLQR